MNRAALARELFDLHQDMREKIQLLKADASTVDAHDAATALGILVNRAEKVVEGYVASTDSGAFKG